MEYMQATMPVGGKFTELPTKKRKERSRKIALMILFVAICDNLILPAGKIIERPSSRNAFFEMILLIRSVNEMTWERCKPQGMYEDINFPRLRIHGAKSWHFIG